MKKNKYIQFDDGSVVLKKERKIGVKELIISIVLALMLFLSLLVIEGKMLNDYKTSEVIVANHAISKSTQITESNAYLFFSRKEVPSNIIPKTAVVDIKDLIGKVVCDSISDGEIIVDARFSAEEEYLAKIKNPLEVGMRVSNLSQIVGGTIRKGDLINIFVVDSSTRESVVVLKNVYVSKAFDTSGVEIKDSGSDVESLSLNLYIDSSVEQYFDETIASGTVYISKVLKE